MQDLTSELQLEKAKLLITHNKLQLLQMQIENLLLLQTPTIEKILLMTLIEATLMTTMTPTILMILTTTTNLRMTFQEIKMNYPLVKQFAFWLMH
jgi:hypothetical protein